MSLNKLLENWRQEHPSLNFPDFDPVCSKSPHTLIFLESPGPEVLNSTIVSISNDDETAKELKRLCEYAFGDDAQKNVLIWNAIPWHLDGKEEPSMQHINKAKQLHKKLLLELNQSLNQVILLGKSARDLLPFFSGLPIRAKFYGGHHTGKKASNKLILKSENEMLFERLKELHDSQHRAD